MSLPPLVHGFGMAKAWVFEELEDELASARFCLWFNVGEEAGSSLSLSLSKESEPEFWYSQAAPKLSLSDPSTCLMNTYNRPYHNPLNKLWACMWLEPT
ncbi:unnamed protein product [Prunus armeniaca]